MNELKYVALKAITKENGIRIGTPKGMAYATAPPRIVKEWIDNFGRKNTKYIAECDSFETAQLIANALNKGKRK